MWSTANQRLFVQVTLPTGTVMRIGVTKQFLNVVIVPSAADFNHTMGKQCYTLANTELTVLERKCWTPSIIIHFLMMHYTFGGCVICCCYYCLIMYCWCVCLPVFACMPLWPDIQIFCLIGGFTNTVQCLMFCLYMCEGLCGTYDGNRDNDLLQNNGQVYEGRGLQPDPFSLSWR